MKRKFDFEIGLRCADFVRDYASYKRLSITAAMSRLGIARKSLYAWENGYSSPSAFTLKTLVECGASAEYLLTGVNEENGSKK